MKNIWKPSLIILIILLFTASCSHTATTENAAVPPLNPPAPDMSKLYELTVKKVAMDYVDKVGATPIILLVNKNNDEQFLAIWVGMSEGASIDMALQKSIPPRPGTHDLFANFLAEFRMKLVKVVIADIHDKTYVAAMTVESNGETKNIDARPSDAIALALRLSAPIYVSGEVIRKVGWMKILERSEKPEKTDKEGDVIEGDTML